MSRDFKVGDPVSAEKTDVRISKGRITRAGQHQVRVNGILFVKRDVNHREYKDQFSPWKESSLRDSDATIRAVSNQLIIMMEQ